MDPYCHLCNEGIAVTSDGVCSSCASKHPLAPKPPSKVELLRGALEVARLQFHQIRDETKPSTLAHALAKTGANSVKKALDE